MSNAANKVKPMRNRMLEEAEEEEEDKSEKCHQFKDVARKYKIETSLHGLKYIAENDRNIFERIFWIVCVLLAWFCAGFLIYKVRTILDKISRGQNAVVKMSVSRWLGLIE